MKSGRQQRRDQNLSSRTKVLSMQTQVQLVVGEDEGGGLWLLLKKVVSSCSSLEFLIFQPANPISAIVNYISLIHSLSLTDLFSRGAFEPGFNINAYSIRQVYIC
jgi:hypothetical protein